MNDNIAMIGSRSKLINQLVYFDEELHRFLEVFVQEKSKKSEVEKTVHEYMEVVERILANFNEESINSVVLIGSTVEVYYLDDHINETFTIVFPYQANPEKDLISFLSPVGSQLLLAKANQTYKIKLPFGDTSVIVKKITFTNSALIG
ncbi:hypothetical protein BTR23_19070 [Alkalihalophilus pseudofirmus]|nr:hypothetical protein BTR23_19070 [Alkalihalophilus pseudofirmus]